MDLGCHLIILDWDDTLVASSWINEFITSDEGNRMPTPCQQKRLKSQENASISFLKTLLQEGCTLVVVTNANQKWLTYTGSLYPYLWEFVISHNIAIVSARDAYGSLFEHSWQWKCRTFEDVIKGVTTSPSYFDSNSSPSVGAKRGDSSDSVSVSMYATTAATTSTTSTTTTTTTTTRGDEAEEEEDDEEKHDCSFHQGDVEDRDSLKQKTQPQVRTDNAKSSPLDARSLRALVSFGDGLDERKAVMETIVSNNGTLSDHYFRAPDRLSVKFLPRPSVLQVEEQLVAATSNIKLFPTFCDNDADGESRLHMESEDNDLCATVGHAGRIDFLSLHEAFYDHSDVLDILKDVKAGIETAYSFSTITNLCPDWASNIDRTLIFDDELAHQEHDEEEDEISSTSSKNEDVDSELLHVVHGGNIPLTARFYPELYSHSPANNHSIPITHSHIGQGTNFIGWDDDDDSNDRLTDGNGCRKRHFGHIRIAGVTDSVDSTDATTTITNSTFATDQSSYKDGIVCDGEGLTGLVFQSTKRLRTSTLSNQSLGQLTSDDSTLSFALDDNSCGAGAGAGAGAGDNDTRFGADTCTGTGTSRRPGVRVPGMLDVSCYYNEEGNGEDDCYDDDDDDDGPGLYITENTSSDLIAHSKSCSSSSNGNNISPIVYLPSDLTLPTPGSLHSKYTGGAGLAIAP